MHVYTMCVCMHVCACILHLCVCARARVCMFVYYVYVHLELNIALCLQHLLQHRGKCMCMYLRMHVCIYVCHACMYDSYASVCTFVYVYKAADDCVDTYMPPPVYSLV